MLPLKKVLATGIGAPVSHDGTALRSYMDRFGHATVGRGGLAIGDPSLFAASGVHVPSTDKWCVAIDDDAAGDPWLVLIGSYDYASLALRNPAGWAPVYPSFRSAEVSISNVLGLTSDERYYVTGQQVFATPPADFPAFDGTVRFGGQVIATIGGAPGAGQAPIPAGVTRAGISRLGPFPATINTPQGKIPVLLTGNPWLRIAFISGFPGTVIGGDTWVAEAIRTLVDVVIIIVGAWTGATPLISVAVGDIISTWYQYAQAIANAKQTVALEGNALSGIAKPLAKPLAGGAPPPVTGGGGGGSAGIGEILLIALVAWLVWGAE